MSIHVKQIPAVGETVLGKKLGKAAGEEKAQTRHALWESWEEMDAFVRHRRGRGRHAASGKPGRVRVNLQHVKICPEENTGMAVVCVSDRGENNIIVVGGANTQCDPSYLEEREPLFRNCDILLLQMEIPVESVAYAVKSQKPEKTVILNLAPVPENFPEELFKICGLSDPNEIELFALAKMEIKTI